MTKNPANIEEFIERDPLLLYDFYPMLQLKYVVDLGSEILAILDERAAAGAANQILVAHRQLWFWVLGAYEVVRHLDEYAAAFSDEAQARTKRLKKLLHPVRIRFAKHQKPGKDVVDRGQYFSISGFGIEGNDMEFMVGEDVCSARTLITAFADYKAAFKRDDVVARLRSTE